MRKGRTDKQRLETVRRGLERIIDYPPDNHFLRGEDGYPVAVEYNEFTYRRMVDLYREAISNVLEESRKK